jgi:predicted nucleic acid binding AN1-type Zn finger protein
MIGRCVTCKKKIGLIKFKCKFCEYEFCIQHRLPEDHTCEKDFKTILQAKLNESIYTNSSVKTQSKVIKI